MEIFERQEEQIRKACQKFYRDIIDPKDWEQYVVKGCESFNSKWTRYYDYRQGYMEAGEKYNVWHEGIPRHPFDKEWFIAIMKNGERVVLRALPKEFTYDFKTADDTYTKKENIKGWMQFPDSSYIAHESKEHFHG